MQTVDKFQRILDLMTRPGSLSTATTSSSSSGNRQVKIDAQAAGLLRDYIEEVAHSVVEEAAVLCRHRKGKHIGANDINLILAKKLDLHVPGSQRPTVHDKHALKLHRLDNTYLVEEDAAPASAAPAPALVTGVVRVSAQSTDSKDNKETEKTVTQTGTATSSASNMAVSALAKRKGAKRKQQEATSSSESVANKQAKL